MDEPEVQTPQKRTRTKKVTDARIIGARVIEKQAAPAEVQRAWLTWYDGHSDKEKAIICDTMNHLKYSNTGVGYRVMMSTYQAWEEQGIVGGFGTRKPRATF